METVNKTEQINSVLSELNSPLQKTNEAAIILAAGHGKRIKSNVSKMLHRIWGVPTVVRVYDACKDGLDSPAIIIVVGIKADEVAQEIGKKENTNFVFQEVQNGTGHAVQIALSPLREINFEGTFYVFPGDMGLIDSESVKHFKESFQNSNADMMVLIGIYEGDYQNNY
ncbi:MAG: NTP transferase domain-containing protein, partial [Ignavibacteria bacterium]|nr:NTP transferase domain-containing protein [Ignavibacteria bacterium]